MNELTPLKRAHAKRLREVYRSAGWPYQDIVEIDLLAAGLLERIISSSGHELVRVTDAGIAYLAGAVQGNRQARSNHDALVDTGYALDFQQPAVRERKTTRRNGHISSCWTVPSFVNSKETMVL